MGYAGSTPGGQYSAFFSDVFGAKQPSFSTHQVFPGDRESDEAKALKNNRFMVKVQIPTDSECQIQQCLSPSLQFVVLQLS